MKAGQQAQVSIEKILFASDFSPAAEAGFAYALAIADSYHAKLYVAHVIDAAQFDVMEPEQAERMIEKARTEAQERIRAFLSERIQVDGNRCEILIAEGPISDVLIDIIQRHRIDVAAVGTHGREGFEKLRMGSIAEEIFRKAPCPVLTAGPNTERGFGVPGAIRHILYAVEFAPDRSSAAAYAVSLAERYAAKLTVVNIREDMERTEDATRYLEQPRKSWLEDHVAPGSDLRQRIRFDLGFGVAADAIVDLATKQNVDLIVMSVRELDPFMAAHLPTSDTAHAVVSHAPCPVLTIK